MGRRCPPPPQYFETLFIPRIAQRGLQKILDLVVLGGVCEGSLEKIRGSIGSGPSGRSQQPAFGLTSVHRCRHLGTAGARRFGCSGRLQQFDERFDAGGQHGVTDDPDYLDMNPNGRVPTIDDDGFVLWESNAIVRYLAARHGMGTLCPEDPRRRADADRWMTWQSATVGRNYR